MSEGDTIPQTQPPTDGCPFCDSWQHWVKARMQEVGSFQAVVVQPSELHDMLLVGAAIMAAEPDVLRVGWCDLHERLMLEIRDAIINRRKEAVPS